LATLTLGKFEEFPTLSCSKANISEVYFSLVYSWYIGIFCWTKVGERKSSQCKTEKLTIHLKFYFLMSSAVLCDSVLGIDVK
jgi:hypothetical protein